jgi:hypothetical protein
MFVTAGFPRTWNGDLLAQVIKSCAGGERREIGLFGEVSFAELSRAERNEP